MSRRISLYAKMFAAKIFGEELYTAHVVDVENIIRFPEGFRDRSPVPFTTEVTNEWFSREVRKAYFRDLADQFYADEIRERGLEDVALIRQGLNLVVVTEDKNFFGKISIFPNDAHLTLNAVFLYVSGDRRRRTRPAQRTPSRTTSAGIVWYFVAQFAEQRYKAFARVLIPSPLPTIFKYLLQYEALFVEIKVDTIRETGGAITVTTGLTDVPDGWDYLRAKVSDMNSFEKQDRILRYIRETVAASEPDEVDQSGIPSYGALFQASSLITRIT